MLTRGRIMGILLVVSWTLNVALGVTLYYSSRISDAPRAPFWRHPPPLEAGMAPPPGLPPEFRDNLRRDIEPLMEEQHRFSQQVYAVMTADTLDTMRLALLADSLGEMRCQIQQRMISQMAGLHSKLSPEQRQKICSRMIGRFDGEGHKRRPRHDDRETPSKD